jgi:RNA polymerase sigma-70 factor (ECF subfamily)
MTGVDEASWVELYRALEKPLYNVVYRWLWDRMESQDVVQEAFLRCWRARGRIRPEGFNAFVFRTALNLAFNRRRRKKLWRFVSLDAWADEPASEHDGAPILSRRVQRAIDTLPEGLKRVLLLCELAGMTYGEVAAVTGVREGTVGSRRNRALSLLRKRLHPEEELTDADGA